MKTNEIRSKFLNYFKSLDHRVVNSDSLIPTADPTLLFTSAGMVQFKKHFLGLAAKPLKRAASCQRCLRTSDIERVGSTARHLTFFEMLGNFSFGDYFKEEAIAWGWKFLTKECGLDPKLLYASIYKEDEEAYKIWKKIIPESKIVRLGEESNFWNMGETGPCGPCSEILYDRGEKVGDGLACHGPGCDCDRYLEVWNLVFTQFNKLADKSLKPLPQKNIDTGMGLERLNLVINGLDSAFDMDYFKALGEEITKHLGTPKESSLRIVADHIRSATFLISDGILPSNEGRGYILRRLIRRALRQGWVHGKKEPFLYSLVSVIVKEMGTAYPEIKEREKNIESIIQTEEKNSLESIEVGTHALEEEVKKAVKKSVLKAPLGTVSLDGNKIFYIYDTYGLDKEIQKEIVRDWGGELKFVEEDYERARNTAVETARKGWKGSGEEELTIYTQLKKKLGNTVFKGYETLTVHGKVLALLKGKNREEVGELTAGEEGEVILSESSFYAESGGQVGDKGTLGSSDGKILLEVLDTQKPLEDFIAHEVKIKNGTVRVGQILEAIVDSNLRKATMRHHTATHLLHAALRKIIGSQVTQAGSLVSPQKLRFDFTAPKALTPNEIAAIEQEVTKNILDNIPRVRSVGSLEKARSLGALAFFGEKYGDEVFVVNYGGASTEVCGGTHCNSTGEIGLFKIISESSVGSNVRRIEALAGEAAYTYIQNEEKILQSISFKLKSTPAESPEKVDKLLQKVAELEKQLNQHHQKEESGQWSTLVEKAKNTSKKVGENHIKILVEEIATKDPKRLREAADHLKVKLLSGIVVLATQQEEKISFVVSITPDCVGCGISASNIAKEFAKLIEGSAGGKELFAQGGGRNVPDLKKVLENFQKELRL